MVGARTTRCGVLPSQDTMHLQKIAVHGGCLSAQMPAIAGANVATTSTDLVPNTT